MMGRTTAFPSQFSGKKVRKKKKRGMRRRREREIAEGKPENPRADAQRSERERRPGSSRQAQGNRKGRAYLQAQQLVSSGRRRAAGADSGAVNANSSAANSAGSSADSSRAAQSTREEASVEEPRRRGGEVARRRDDAERLRERAETHAVEK